MTDESPPLRFSPGGDEFLFVEVSEEMSLPAYFRVMAITHSLEEADVGGVRDICPANASFQVFYDPDIVAPKELEGAIAEISDEVGDGLGATIDTTIIEVPVFYQDPWTHETLMRFRDNHQTPDKSDLEYGAEVNGLDSVEAFVEAHHSAPWFTSMVGFVAGLPFLYQMVRREHQLQVPKYLRPRTDTPALTVGHGGAFGCVYSVRGAGGYQMFGITPYPIYDPSGEAPFGMFRFNPGDIVRYRPIDADEYEEARQAVAEGEYNHFTMPWTFDPSAFLDDPDSYNTQLLEEFNGAAN